MFTTGKKEISILLGLVRSYRRTRKGLRADYQTNKMEERSAMDSQNKKMVAVTDAIGLHAGWAKESSERVRIGEGEERRAVADDVLSPCHSDLDLGHAGLRRMASHQAEPSAHEEAQGHASSISLEGFHEGSRTSGD